MYDPEQIKKDITLLLSFAPATDPEDVIEGLCPTFYITGTYEGDLAIVERIKIIKDRYGIDHEIITGDLEDA